MSQGRKFLVFVALYCGLLFAAWAIGTASRRHSCTCEMVKNHECQP